ncbi:hypothetical protein OH492_10535 [Vibrio chagasii]|nr:hypothetical protein [Vibrio chagasii]
MKSIVLRHLSSDDNEGFIRYEDSETTEDNDADYCSHVSTVILTKVKPLPHRVFEASLNGGVVCILMGYCFKL